MKAKDTVMNKSVMYGVATKGQGGTWPGGYCRRVAEVQAEISFRAGIKEVVDWLKPHMTFMRWQYKDSEGIWDCPIDGIEWHSKLEEWGINP